jgi:hypothetical protein
MMTEPPPEEVARIAAERGLGECIDAQRGTNPFTNFAWGMAAFLVLFFGGCLGVAWIGVHLHLFILRAIVIASGAASIVVLIMSIRVLFAGFTATYLYTNGLVHTKNRKIEAVTWPEVDELLLWKGGGKNGKGLLYGKLLCYYVVTFDGRKVSIEAQPRNPLGEQLEQIVRQLGRPVSDSGPYTGRLRV